jgi:FkbM family methyltransferase
MLPELDGASRASAAVSGRRRAVQSEKSTMRPAPATRLPRMNVHRAAAVTRRHLRAAITEIRNPPTPSPPRESRPDKARRRGYIYHGEQKYKIAYDPDIITDPVIDTISDGHYERFEARRAAQMIEDGDRVIELGAGLGFLSTLILDRKKVTDYQAVEADPRLPAMIQRTHDLNNARGPLTIHNAVATCDKTMIDAGTVEFYVGEKFCASSLLGTMSTLKHTVRVPVVSLPEMIDEHRSNALILDIEGAEVGVMNGTPLDGITKILMETHPHRIGPAGIRDLFRNLDAQGFMYVGEWSAGHVTGFRRV